MHWHIVVLPEFLSDVCNEIDNWMICELCDMTQKPQFMILVECLFTKLVVVAIKQGAFCKIKMSYKNFFFFLRNALYGNNMVFSSRYTNIPLYGKVSYLVIWCLNSCYESTLIPFFKDWSYIHCVDFMYNFSE